MGKRDEGATDEPVPTNAATASRLRTLRPIRIAISRVGTILPSPRLYYSAMIGLAVATAPLVLLLVARWVMSLLLPGFEAKIVEGIIILVPTGVLPLAAIVTWWVSRNLAWVYWSTTWERQSLLLLDTYEPYDKIEFRLLRARIKPHGSLNAAYLRLWCSREQHAIRTGERTVASGRQAKFLAGEA